MTGDPNRDARDKIPAPTMADFIETKIEQSGLAMLIFGLGAIIALVVFAFGAAVGIGTIAGVIALAIFIAAMLLATFVGHDTNYMVARMRERAKERADSEQS